MIENPMDVLNQFPVRKSKKQKQAFRDAVQSYADTLGYPCTVEKGSMGARNVVIGDPQKAKYLVTAHYDTCAWLPFPNIVTPTNLVTFVLYQTAVVLVYLGAAILAGVAVGLAAKSKDIGFWAGFAFYYVLLGLMMAGPANKTNANDNTSGVVTILETMRNLPAEYRDRVCFVLFDLEEAGLIGSSSYQKKHKKETKEQLLINLDCVGDGNEIIMLPGKKVRKNQRMTEELRSICGSRGEKSLTLHEKSFSVYPSDQSNFPNGVAVGAFHRKKWVGPYYSRIHTHKDTILEEENVSILRDAILRLIRAA